MQQDKNPNSPQPQTAENPSGEKQNPFANQQSVEKDIAQAGNALDDEQQFKQAQTERD